MPTDHDRDHNGISPEEYRRQHEMRARRRKKRRNQKLMLLGAFALAAILLVVCIVMIFNAIFGKGKKPKVPSTTSIAEMSESEAEPPPPAIPIAADPNVWNLKLVNEQFPMTMAQADYLKNTKDALAFIGGAGYWIDAQIYNEYTSMVAACNAEVAGGTLKIVSGYRSYERQNSNFTSLVAQYKKSGMGDAEAKVEAWKTTPPAGMTEHHTGLAVDFVTDVVSTTKTEFDQTPEFAWLVAHAADYGFVLRYPADKVEITGVAYKPWHWRFVGVAEAQAMSGAGITLEEYVRVEPKEAPVETTPEGESSSVLG